MTPFEVYVTFLAFKSHFTRPNYDYFKYNGKTRASVESFNKRKDRYFFERLSRKRNDQEIKEFFVSNFIECSDPQSLWIGQIIKEGEDNYKNWQQRTQSLSYRFSNEVESLFDGIKFDDAFKCSNGKHPLIVKKYFSRDICIETFVILNQILGFQKHFDEKLKDPVWENESIKLKKYSPFINIDTDKYIKILKGKVLNE
jgi:hypothetical protein